MLGINWLKISIYGGSALFMICTLWYLIYQYHTGQEAKAELATVKQSLTDERSCLVGTSCAIREQKEADEMAAKVKEVQDAADKQNAITKADHDAKEKSAAQSHEQIVKQLQGKLAERDKQLAEIASHDKPCRDWLNEALPECVL